MADGHHADDHAVESGRKVPGIGAIPHGLGFHRVFDAQGRHGTVEMIGGGDTNKQHSVWAKSLQ